MTAFTRIHKLVALPKMDGRAVMLEFVPHGHPSLEELHQIAYYKFPIDEFHHEIVNVYSAGPLEEFMYDAVLDYINHAPFMVNG